MNKNIFLTVIILLLYLASCKKSNSKSSSEIGDMSTSEHSLLHTDSMYQDKNDAEFVPDTIVIKEELLTNLSYTHNFKLTLYDIDEVNHWKIMIYDKKMNVVDSISIQDMYCLYPEFIDNKFSASYITGINKNKLNTEDRYKCIFLVADFNFDSKDDFIIVWDMGAQAGNIYEYYIQQDNNKFVLDTFLTEQVSYFPTKTDAKNRQLTVESCAGGDVRKMIEDTYELDKANNWKEVSSRIID